MCVYIFEIVYLLKKKYTYMCVKRRKKMRERDRKREKKRD